MDRFHKVNPPSFEGHYNPDGPQKWLQEVEYIFQRSGMSRRSESEFGNLYVDGRSSTLYFPEDIRYRKEMEFVKLEQENMSVAEYAAKFEELSRYYPFYVGEVGEKSKCIKFEMVHRPEIKKQVEMQEIRDFSTLVNKNRIYDEDSHAKKAHY
ncbi:uncharacterized protein [Cicer arietinum]|uniref:Uncharacterized protein LOC101510912 n=1 Tax=Cicer arietinum TaxID=3827 RepID=A0A1S2Z711_CICAR|nr:uncharacterized protein LOC101510912 [Cicer arietinum]